MHLAKFTTTADDDFRTLEEEFVNKGFIFEIGECFAKFSEIARQSERHSVAPQFEKDYLASNNIDAFWICSRDKSGELTHTQAFQMLNLNGSSVAHHIWNTRAEYVPSRPAVDLDKVSTRLGPRTAKLSGTSVYHGEMWLSPRLRGGGIATLLIRYGMHHAVERWNPDSIFGLMSWELASDGFNSRIGYMHCEPLSVIWQRKNADKDQHQVWTVYMERQDLEHLFSLPVVEFARHLDDVFKGK